MTHDEKSPLFSERVREQLLLQRILVLDGVLDDDNGTLLATQLLTLAVEDPAADIALWINSPGGSVPSMLAIRDLMRLVPCDVTTLALGLACSAGQFLLSAGTKGKRFALPHARILMHRGSAGIGGSAVDIEVQADDLRHTVDTVLGLIAADTGQPVERIFDDSLHDHWYTAAEAREYGFIDEIVGSFGQIMPARRHRIGLKGPEMTQHEQLHHPECDRSALRAASGSWTCTRTCSPSGSCTSAPRSIPGVANALIAQLLHLEAESQELEINLYINCEGGDLPSMLAVYDTMQYIQAPVATTCVGQAIGVGAVLLAAGTAGRRSLLPHARVVLYQPAARGQGPIPDLILQADEVVRMRADIEAILSAHTGQSAQTLRARHRPGPGAHRAGGAGVRDRRSGAGPADRGCRPSGLRSERQHDRAGRARRPDGLLAAQVAGDLLGQHGERGAQRAGQGRDHLAGRLLAAALDLGQVLGRDPGPAGRLGQGFLLIQAQRAQTLAEHLPPQWFGGRVRRWCSPGAPDEAERLSRARP